MQINKIRKIAGKLGVVHETMKMEELIRVIQEKEGNIPCFRIGLSSCHQFDCSWRTDCKPGETKALHYHSDS
ncbi:MAG: hypothetical protein AB7U29_14470 [Desulfobulbus sp.]